MSSVIPKLIACTGLLDFGVLPGVERERDDLVELDVLEDVVLLEDGDLIGVFSRCTGLSEALRNFPRVSTN